MNRKQFQEWLEQFPEDTIIELAFQENPGFYQSYGPVLFKAPELKTPEEFSVYADFGEGVEYNDWSQNRFSNSTEKTLRLGESC